MEIYTITIPSYRMAGSPIYSITPEEKSCILPSNIPSLSPVFTQLPQKVSKIHVVTPTLKRMSLGECNAWPISQTGVIRQAIWKLKVATSLRFTTRCNRLEKTVIVLRVK